MKTQANADYIFEPYKAEIVKGLIPKSLKTQLYKALKRLICFRTRSANDCNAQGN